MAGNPESLLKAIIDNGGNTSRLFADVESAFQAAGGLATEEVLAEVEVAAPEAAVAVTDTFVGLGGWIVLIVVIVVLLALRLLENVILGALRLIPYWGKNIANTARGWFKWLDHLEEWAIRGFVQSMGRMIHGLFVFVGIASDAHQAQQAKSMPKPRAAPGQYATVKEAQYLQHQINGLNQRMNYVQYVLDPTFLTSGAAVPAPSPAPQPSTTTTIIRTGVPANVWAQIHSLQAEVSTLRGDMTNAFHQLDRLTASDTALQREFQQLSGSIHSIRAVATGWQEIEDQLQLVSAVLLDFTDTAAAQFAKHDRLLTRLEPLNLLQQPGLPGLKILRQLEDTPCMCPKLPSIPRLAPELLALYEFASYG